MRYVPVVMEGRRKRYETEGWMGVTVERTAHVRPSGSGTGLKSLGSIYVFFDYWVKIN